MIIIKILSVSTIPDNSAEWIRVSKIIEILRSANHEVDIIHYIRKSTYIKFQNNSDYDKHLFEIVALPTVHIKHLKLLYERDYDLVYGNSFCTFFTVLGKLTTIPLIFDMHGGLAEEFWFMNHQRNVVNQFRFFMSKFIDFTNLHCSDKIICVSKKMIEYLNFMKKIPVKKISYVTNGVDLNFFKPIDENKIDNLRCKLGLKNKFVFGYIGNFQQWQGVNNLIESAMKIKDKNINFLIVGGNKKLRNKNIIFIPRVPYDQTLNYYALCDVLVLPRPSHPATEIAAPTKFAEYVAMGKPVLVTNVGDAAEFVKEYGCGLVIKDNNPYNLIEGIRKFKNMPKNELIFMAENSRKLAKNEFDWQNAGKNLLRTVSSIYEK